MDTFRIVVIDEEAIADPSAVKTLADIPVEARVYSEVVNKHGKNSLTLKTGDFEGRAIFAAFEDAESEADAKFLGWYADYNGRKYAFVFQGYGEQVDMIVPPLINSLLEETAKLKGLSDISHVGDTEHDGVRVSTVHLPLNHQWDSRKPPLYYETMVFGGEFDGEMERYSTFEEAQAGHGRMVAKVFGGK